MRCGLTSADSGLQLDLETALNVVSAKIEPHELFSSAENTLKRRVTKSASFFEPFPNKCKALFALIAF